MYRRLVECNRAGLVSFKEVITFNLDEYFGISDKSRQSYRHYMDREFFDQTDIQKCNTHLPRCSAGENPILVGTDYESRIKQVGGIDLQVLGIGQNGHIGFNEPTSSIGSRTRIKTLTKNLTLIPSRYDYIN